MTNLVIIAFTSKAWEVNMGKFRLIKRPFLREAALRHPEASSPIFRWERIVQMAQWSCFDDLKKTFPNADQAPVASGRIVTIFNIGGNAFRLIAAVHYPKRENKGRIFLLRFFTHAQYDKLNRAWKKQL